MTNTKFLENELKNTKQPWKIVAMHNPLYTSPSNHPEEKELATRLQPLFDKYGVDLVIYGHNHNYERIKLPDKTTLFVREGTDGESHYDIKGSRSGGGVEFQNDNDYGFVKLTINSNAFWTIYFTVWEDIGFFQPEEVIECNFIHYSS